MFWRAASNFWFCWVTSCACVGGVGAGGRLVATTRGGFVRGRGRSAGATTRVSGRTLPPCAWGRGGSAAGGCSAAGGLCCGDGWVGAGVSGAEGEAVGSGVGEAAPACANAGAVDAATSISVEADRRRLRGMRMDAEYMGIPDWGDSHGIAGEGRRKPWHARKPRPIATAVLVERYAAGAAASGNRWSAGLKGRAWRLRDGMCACDRALNRYVGKNGGQGGRRRRQRVPHCRCGDADRAEIIRAAIGRMVLRPISVVRCALRGEDGLAAT